jgi:hypothetical protein
MGIKTNLKISLKVSLKITVKTTRALKATRITTAGTFHRKRKSQSMKSPVLESQKKQKKRRWTLRRDSTRRLSKLLNSTIIQTIIKIKEEISSQLHTLLTMWDRQDKPPDRDIDMTQVGMTHK